MSIRLQILVSSLLLPCWLTGGQLTCEAVQQSSPDQSTEKSAAEKAADGDKPGDKSGDKPDSEELVSTEHVAEIAGRQVRYTATAGKLLLKNDALKSRATVFFVAYTVPSESAAERPVTFCFNGGPGSSSVWLHLGMLGPKRIRFPEDATYLQPPYALEANPFSLLDVTDLVFIDPVSTGYSRPADEVSRSEFHGYEEDIQSVGQFIHDYTTRFLRWGSPRFLCGESYGGLRAAGLTAHLQERYNMELNGVLVISGAVNFQTLRFSSSNDLPNICFLPGYAATAWYHRALSAEMQARTVAEVVADAERFALGPYAQALLKGTAISEAEERTVARQMSVLTGLSEEYLLRARLRVSMGRFGKELLR
jgi:carboxypeptidase C (cathepsin A)